MSRRVLALIAVLALTTAACAGDSDEPAAPTGDSPTTTAAMRDDTGASGATLELTARGTAFDKTALSAAAGKVSIRFENRDAGIPHNLHVSGQGVDDKTEIKNGPTTQRLDLDLAPGAYSYVCDVHPSSAGGELSVS